VGTVLPYVVAFNAELAEVRAAYAELTRADLAPRLRNLVALAGMPTSLAPSGVAEGDVAALAEEAAQQWTARFNPCPVDESAFRRLFEAALAGDL
jgi:alcohol dehydrogenase class IV